MHLNDTPPMSPNGGSGDDDDDADIELADEDIEEVIDPEDEGATIESDSEEDNMDGEGNSEDDADFVFSKHTGSIFCCHLDPRSGKLAVTGGEDENVYIWDVQSGEVIFHGTGHKDSVTNAAFSHDGTLVAAGDLSGVIQVWKMSNKKLIWDFSTDDLSWLQWHHGAHVLLGGTVPGDVYMWKVPSGDCKVLQGHGERTECGVVMPDGKRAAVGYSDGAIKVFDLKEATIKHQIPIGQAHQSTVTSIDCLRDNNLIITGGTDGNAAITKTQTGKVACILPCGSEGEDKHSVEAVGFCTDLGLGLAATGNLGGDLVIWDIAKQIKRHGCNQVSGITKLLWQNNSSLVVTAGLDGKVRLFDARSGNMESVLAGHSGDVLDISLLADGSTLLTASDDTTARVFSLTRLDR